MTIARRRLEEAAFWNFAVCLDCQGLFDPDTLGEDPTCPACQSARLFPADTILACADFVEDPDE